MCVGYYNSSSIILCAWICMCSGTWAYKDKGLAILYYIGGPLLRDRSR